MTDKTLTVEGRVRPEQKSVLQTGVHVDASAYADFVGASSATVTTDSMAALSSMAEEMLARERDLRAALAALVKAQENLANVKEERLPDLMDQFGLTRFDFVDKLTNIKRTIELNKNKWRVSLPAKQGNTMDPAWAMKHAAVYEWLPEIGQGGAIKKDVMIPCGLMPDDEVLALAAKIKELNPTLDVGVDKYVEPAALTKIISDRMKQGLPVNEYINVKPVREAKIKGAK